MSKLSEAIAFLEAPFPEGVKWRLNDRLERVRAEGKGLFLPYVPIELVIKRLNDALKAGFIEDWTATYEPLPPLREEDEKRKAGGRGEGVLYVLCTLKLKVAGEWHQRIDVGEGGDYKEAFSDALKRTAKHFGVGAYVSYMSPKEVPARGLTPTDSKPLKDEERRVIALYFGGGGTKGKDPPSALHQEGPEPLPKGEPHRGGEGGQEGGEDELVQRLRKAHQSIGKMVEELKALGGGAQAAKLLLEHHWVLGELPPNPSPEDIERAGELYRALKGLKARLGKGVKG